ncbi:MAG: 50S ribosomal protein L21 [Dehalococcoidia bacterium]
MVVVEAKDYAIVRAGGKQRRVTVGDTLRVDRLPQEPGSAVDLEEVMLLSRKGEVSVGAPLLKGAKVKAKVVEHGRGDKITVFKYKSKVRYRRKLGHRQPYTDLIIERINAGRRRGGKPAKAKTKEDSED